jgi:hypothetical protein
VALVEAGDVILTKDLAKVNKWIKASEVEDEKATEEEKDPHIDVETPRISNAATARSLDIMPQIVGTKTMNKSMLHKQQMIFVVSLPYFSLMMIQIYNMRLCTLILAQAIICVGGEIYS